MLAADTNIFVHAADPDSPLHAKARNFFKALVHADEEFVLCELVLVELYMLLRNPAVFAKPYTPSESAGYCRALRQNPWRCIDYDPKFPRTSGHTQPIPTLDTVTSSMRASPSSYSTTEWIDLPR